MARARTIKPQFIWSRSMRAVSPMARLTFIQLWLVADDAGRVLAHPLALARRLYPSDAEAVDLLPGWLAELEGQHCIERYIVDRMDYLRIANWHRHQKIYHPTPSRLPARPVGVRKDSGAIREAFGSNGEKPSADKALASAGDNSRAIREPRESLGKNPGNPDAPGVPPVFTSDSRGDVFFRRAVGIVQRTLARASYRAFARG